RRFLLAGGAVLSGATTGCLDRLGFGGDGSDETVERPSATSRSGSRGAESGTYTTVERTETFAELTGERTPFPPVQPVRLGSGGRLLILF
ncbi:MAG: hypothetical protein ABEI99_07950, partial [Halobaculum sp.]